MYNLNWDETRAKRQLKFYNSIGFRIIIKIIMNPKDNGFTIKELHHRYVPWKDILQDFESLFWMVAFKVITADKDMPNVCIKVTIIVSIYVILMFLV